MNWRPVEQRPRGRPRIRWEDQIHEDIGRIVIDDWRSMIQDRKTWKKKQLRRHETRQNVEESHKREDQGARKTESKNSSMGIA
jgi:hypothetical protein